ncbi:hypothetical protein [Neisseria sp. Ec49-e6-T10]|uniref:hypothetical protein n=1 Tax=Neisseria sp. Ec49-e6-T10 TaxID=3140744 RepID=UPI003EB6BE9F
MTETDQRITELENRLNNLQSLSGGILKLLFLSMSYHTHNGSLTEEQKATMKEKMIQFLEGEPALLDILENTEYSNEIADITQTMDLP